MNNPRDARALLYLENVTVERITQHGDAWRVDAKLERETREGLATRWYALWYKIRPDYEKGWVINASGFLQVKAYLDKDNQPRAYTNLQSARTSSAVPPSAATDPWAGDKNDGGWN